VELLGVSRPSRSCAVKASRPEQIKMKGGRPAEKRAGPAVPDRYRKWVNLFDGGDDVSVEIYQFETKPLHLAPDKVQRFIEKKHRRLPRSPLGSAVSALFHGNQSLARDSALVDPQ